MSGLLCRLGGVLTDSCIQLGSHSRREASARRHAFGALVLISASLLAPTVEAQYRKIGEMELRLSGVSATVENAEPVVPKHTPGGIRVLVRAGGVDLSLSDLSRFLGANFAVRGDLSGPGLSQPIALPAMQAGEEPPADPLVLPIPTLPVAGNYRLSNLRIVANGRTVLDVDPSNVPLRVIDQILVTQVTTRALTLDEIKGKGIVLDRDDYLGFEFTMGFKLDSKAIDLKFPVVFDRQGVALPQPLSPPLAPSAEGVAFPTIVPMLLEAETEGGVREELKFTTPTGVTKPITIPAVLVIPGNVGYLKQFFSAQLYVSNGAPVGSGLNVRDIKATLKLPPGVNPEITTDDPLALPEIEREGQVITQPLTAKVEGVGPDALPDTDDDVAELAPGEQGQSEFLIRGEQEGFYQIGFDLTAKLLGLPIGPVTVRGKAMGGVLVRNPYFNVTFTVPSIVRDQQEFTMRATVTNIGKGIGNQVSMTLDSLAISGLRLVDAPSKTIQTLKPGDAKTVEFKFVAEGTGKVVATYLRFDTPSGNSGHLNFKIGLGDRNVPLSPDTLSLPASTDELPSGVVDAAMRVLGQAWSVANAPAGTLPQDVTRINGPAVVKKALALAEAGLRATLGQSSDAAVRDLLYDFFSGSPVDPGFDQLLRTTESGQAFVAAVGVALGDAATQAGGGSGYELETARLLASTAPFGTFAWDGGAGQLAVVDGAGRLTSRSTDPQAPLSLTSQNVVGAVLTPLGSDAILGLLTQPSAGPYTWEFRSASSSLGSLSASFPRADGSFGRVAWSGFVSAGTIVRVVLDSDGSAALRKDQGGDGVFETTEALSVDTLPADGPRLIAAAVIGPETLDGAGPWGFHTALVFDRVVGEASAADTTKYTVPDNQVRSARRQLSGRLVFAGLSLPEGPNVPSRISTRGIEDARGVAGPDGIAALNSRIKTRGAVVSGRVLNAEGGPLVGRTVTYSQQNDPTCLTYPPIQVGLAALTTGSAGEFELRYVSQDVCGGGFKLETVDPSTGALRTQGHRVQVAGEQIVADFVMLAAGSVTGVVKNLSGQAVPGAYVVVLSQTETQVGGTAFTDALGRYTVSGITVGPVVVRAGKGNGAGSSAGRIDRPNVPAVINVTLDGGSVKASGVVRKVEAGDTSPAVGAVVTYSVSGGVMAAGLTDIQGRYSFTDLPIGAFTIKAQATSRDSTQVSGVALAGETVVRDISVEIAPPQSLGYVEGHVKMPDGSAASQAIVSTGAAAVLTDALGAFRLPVTPQGSAHFLTATTRDRKRTGQTTVSLSSSGQTVAGVLITLSGLGSAEFTVLDPLGQPMAGQTVKLLDSQVDPCGRTAALTDSLGRARFTGLGLGAFTGQVVSSGEIIDSARAEVSISGDGQTGFAILRVETRPSSITGVVRNHQGEPVLGADVVLSSPVFVNDPFDFVCGLQSKVSHRARTGLDGRYRFSGVHPGAVYISASQTDFFPVPVSRQLNLTPSEETEFDIVLKNTISGKISGLVFEPDGLTSAGPGVRVTMNGLLPDVTVVTDATGAFGFPSIFPAGPYSLTAEDPITGLLERTEIYVAAHADAAHDIRLKGKTNVQVRVTDALAQPVGQAYVSLKETVFPNRTFEGVVAPSNQSVIEFLGVFEGPIAIEARDPFDRGGRASLTIPTGVHTVEATVRLTTTGTIRGQFLKADGTPIPFGGVKLFVGGRLIGQVTASGTSPVGGFTFSYVPSGDFRLEALDPLSGRTGIATGTIETEGQVVEVNVIAQSVGTVEGVVILNNASLSGARVELVSGSYSATTITDSDGRYSVQGVPEGRVVVSADTQNGFLRATSSGTLQGEGSTLTIDVVLRSTGSIRGQVFKAGGVIPAGVVAVSLYVGGEGGGSVTGSTDEDGTFEFDRVPAGLAQVQVEALGSDDFASGSAEVPALGEAQMNLTLNGIGGLEGQGLDSAGVGVAGTVALFGGPPQRGYYYIIYLDSQGRFQLPRVLAGPFTAHLTVSNSGGPTLYGTASGVVTDGATTSVAIQVQNSGTITGRVLRTDGATPGYGARVTAELGGYATANTQAQSDGRFTIRGATLGNFILRVNDPVTTGVGRATGTVATNGASVDVGDVILDDSPIRIVSAEPADLSVGVGINQVVRLTFTDPLAGTDGISVTSSLGNHGTKALSTDGRVVTIAGPWPDSKDLVIEANTGVTDIFGRHPGQTFTSRFKTLDTSPPTVIGVSPASGAIQVAPGALVVVTFSEPLDGGSDLAELVKVSVGATQLPGLTTLTAANEATFTPTAPLPINSVLFMQVNGARDLTGNTQTGAYTSTFKSTDTVPPNLVLDTPTPSAWVTNRRPLIYVSTTDGLSGMNLSGRTMHLDGIEVAATKTLESIFFTPLSDLTDGQHSIEATATDLAQNVGARSFAFGVDATPPVPAEITSGVATGTSVAGTVTLVATSFDTTSGLAKIEVLEGGVVRATLLPPAFSLPFNTSTLTEGGHTFTARAIDVAGNVASLGAPVSFFVDNVVLSLAITAPANGLRIRDSVVASASTSEPVTRVTFALGATIAESQNAPYSATVDSSALPEGNHTLTVTAYAISGEPTSATVSVFVDRTSPTDVDLSRITADDQGSGLALVAGVAGAAESGGTVEMRKFGTLDVVIAPVAGNGSFAGRVAAVKGDFVEVRAVDSVGNASQWLPIQVIQTINADGLPQGGLALWVKADDGVIVESGLVSKWTDHSGRANHLVQNTLNQRPTTVASAFNGLPVVRFDGNSDFLPFTNRLTNIRTVFWVVKEDSAATSNYRFLLGDGTARHFHGGYGAPGPIWFTSTSPAVLDGLTVLNGVPVNGLTTNRPRTMSILSVTTTAATTANWFGSDAGTGSFWWGDLAEMIIYERPLDDSERVQVEQYLKQKYRPSVPAASTPRISPAGGVFNQSTVVSVAGQPGSVIRYTLDGSIPTDSSAVYADPFTFTATTTLKARAFKAGLDPSSIATATFIETSDAPVADGMALWVRADAGLATDVNYVTVWPDQSIRKKDLVQTEGVRLPRLVVDAANGIPVMRFDGNSDFLKFTQRLENIGTVFWVVREDAAATADYRHLLGDGSTSHFQAGHGAPGPLWLNTAALAVRDGLTTINGTPVDGLVAKRPREMSIVSVTTTGATTASMFGSQNGATGFWWGDLAEMIIYERPLSSFERANVESYLRAKYAIGPKVFAPVATPNGGQFTNEVFVSLKTPTSGAQIYYTLDGTEPTEGATLFTAPFVLDATTTIKAKAFRAGIGESTTTTVAFDKSTDSLPKTVDGLKVWWRADAGAPTGVGEVWKDQSGNGNDGLQTAALSNPQLIPSAVNGLPVMRFDGNSDFMRLTYAPQNVRTVFWVVREDPTATEGYRTLLGDGSNQFLGGPGSQRTIWSDQYASPLVKNGLTVLNGQGVNGAATKRPTAMSVLSVTTTDVTTARWFGSQSGTDNYWWGDLAEMLIYDQPLSSSDRAKIEAYLKAKYAIGAEVVSPVISPAGGLLTGPTNVLMTTATPGATIRYTTDRTEPTPSSPVYTEALQISATTTLKARAFKAGLADSNVTTVGFTQPTSLTPDAFAGMQLWWRADAGMTSSLVDTFKDQSGNPNPNHGTQTSSTAAPTLIQNVVAGLPAVRFNGNSTLLKFNRLTNIRTVFWVVKEDSLATADYRSLLGDGSTVHFHGGLGAPGPIWFSSASPAVTGAGAVTTLNGLSVNGNSTLRPRTMSVVSVTTTAVTSANWFGSLNGTGAFWWGDLAELIIYSEALSPENRQKVEAYLKAKYQIP
jgi:hypothetical protein